MKKINKDTKVILFVLVLLICSAILFLNLNTSANELNYVTTLSNYFSAISSVISLFILIYLTFSISRLDESRSKNEIYIQKKIAQSNFRQAELEKLVIELEKPFSISPNVNRENTAEALAHACVILVNFSNQKNQLFPILRDEEKIGKKVSELIQTLSDFMMFLNSNKKVNNEQHREILLKTMNLKNEIIFILQEYIVEDLDH